MTSIPHVCSAEEEDTFGDRVGQMVKDRVRRWCTNSRGQPKLDVPLMSLFQLPGGGVSSESPGSSSSFALRNNSSSSKPLGGELPAGTVLAAILASNTPEQSEDVGSTSSSTARKINSSLEVLSLGIGTKCVGYSGKEDQVQYAVTLPDCHAEILARKAFAASLIEAASKKSTPSNTTKREEEAQTELHLYVTMPPCGACSISAPAPKVDGTKKEEIVAGEHNCQRSKRRREEEEFVDTTGLGVGAQADAKPLRSVSGSDATTGAKLFRYVESKTEVEISTEEDHVFQRQNTSSISKVDHEQTLQIEGSNEFPYKPEHDRDTLSLRLKPGKGNPSLCMSCSDKILRWQFLGVEGALAGLVLDHQHEDTQKDGDKGHDDQKRPPLYRLSSITVVGDESLQKQVHQGLGGRMDLLLSVATDEEKVALFANDDFKIPQVYTTYINALAPLASAETGGDREQHRGSQQLHSATPAVMASPSGFWWHHLLQPTPAQLKQGMKELPGPLQINTKDGIPLGFSIKDVRKKVNNFFRQQQQLKKEDDSGVGQDGAKTRSVISLPQSLLTPITNFGMLQNVTKILQREQQEQKEQRREEQESEMIQERAELSFRETKRLNKGYYQRKAIFEQLVVRAGLHKEGWIKKRRADFSL